MPSPGWPWPTFVAQEKQNKTDGLVETKGELRCSCQGFITALVRKDMPGEMGIGEWAWGQFAFRTASESKEQDRNVKV